MLQPRVPTRLGCPDKLGPRAGYALSPMARRRVVSLLRPERSRADVRQQLAGASLTPGIQVRERHTREQDPSDWLHESA